MNDKLEKITDKQENFIVKIVLTFTLSIGTVYAFAQWYIREGNLKYFGLIGFILIAIQADQTVKNIMKKKK